MILTETQVRDCAVYIIHHAETGEPVNVGKSGTAQRCRHWRDRKKAVPRLATFFHWASACEPALWRRGEFRRAFAANAKDATEDVIEIISHLNAAASE
jgi:hypothetical protein